MKIHRIETGKVKVKMNQLRRAKSVLPSMSNVLFGREWSGWLPIYAWVIEHKDETIVVDTGDTAKTRKKGYLPKWHPYYALAVDFDIQPDEEIGPKLRKLGIDPDTDISKVILTHMHTDHAGGMYHFPNAEFLIDRKEYESAIGVKGILAGYLPHRWPKWLKPTLVDLPQSPFGPFERSAPVTTDGKINIVATPGHVKNHISVVVEDEGLHYFLAGDTSYTQENMLRGIPDGIGTRQSVETLAKIREFAAKHPTLYLPSHDPHVPKRMEEKRIIDLYSKEKVTV